MSKTVLVFVPHPDDAEFAAAGTLALMAAAGDIIYIVIATDGSKGSCTMNAAQLVDSRAKEAAHAAQIIGAQPPIMLGYADLELDKLPAGELRRQFIYLIRHYKPDVIFAQDPFNINDMHPDHRITAWAACEAINFSFLPLFHPEQIQQGIAPHAAREKYFYYPTREKGNKTVDIAATLELKISALSAHQSQVQFLVEDILKQGQEAGVNMSEILGNPANLHQTALAYAVEIEAAEAAAGSGFTYAEVFRYERYHPLIEQIISDQGH